MRALLSYFIVTLIVFSSPTFSDTTAPHPDFIASFERIERLIRENNLTDAGTQFGYMSDYRRKNGFKPSEEAHYQLLNYWLNDIAGNETEARSALIELVEKGSNLIDADLYSSAAMGLFKAQLTEKAYGEALRTVAAIDRHRKVRNELASVQGVIEKLNAIAEGSDPLIIEGEVDSSGKWSRILLRPATYLDEVQGMVKDFDVTVRIGVCRCLIVRKAHYKSRRVSESALLSLMPNLARPSA